MAPVDVLSALQDAYIVAAPTDKDLFGVANSEQLKKALIAIVGLGFIAGAIRSLMGRQSIRKRSEDLASYAIIAVIVAFGAVAITYGTGFLDWLDGV